MVIRIKYGNSYQDSCWKLTYKLSHLCECSPGDVTLRPCEHPPKVPENHMTADLSNLWNTTGLDSPAT